MGNNESTYIPSDIDQKIQAVNYSVVCGIEIKNSTTHNLHSPKTTIHWGYLLSPPPTSIGPDERGSFIAHKFFGTATGTTGVVSYLVGDTDSRMVVMWSAPFNFDFYDNVLAVGFSQYHDKDIYHRMYDEEGEDEQFSRDKYLNTCNVVKKTKDNITVEGIMGTAHKSKVAVDLKENVQRSSTRRY